MANNNAKDFFWLRHPSHVLVLALGLLLATLILWPPVQADHAGNAESEAANDLAVLEVTEEMTRIAQAIIASVSGPPGNIETAVGYDREALLQLDYEDEARSNWVYWPYLRKGLPLEYMTAAQKKLTHDLIQSALSAKGYLTAVQIMQMESVLQDMEVVGFPRGTEKYTLAIFGEPDDQNQWGWRFEGHHLSLNFAVTPGEVAVTPSFLGASPAELRSGPLAGFRNLRDVHDLGRAFVTSLNPAQQEIAVLDENPPFDILSGNLNKPRDQWDDWKTLPQAGIAVAELDEDQQARMQRIIDEVIGTYRPEIARSYLGQIELDSLYFVWIGGLEPNDAHYYRIEGPDFFFEYDLVQNDGNHVHTVWRSKSGDFGEDLLWQHRQQLAH